MAEALAPAVFCPVPEIFQMGQGKIIELIPVGIVDQKKGDAPLGFELLHELHLMLMNVGEGKGVLRAFLRVEADGQALHRTDIVHRTLLVKIGQGDVPVFLVDADGRDGRGDLLNEREPAFPVFFICPVDQLLQGGTPEAS